MPQTRGSLKSQVRTHSPSRVRPRSQGYGQRGVMVPNPYFQDVGYWEAVRAHVKARAATRPFEARDPRAFWRGNIIDRWHPPDVPGRGAPCENEFGNFARLQALSLSVEHPDVVDVKCWSHDKCQARDETEHACDDAPYVYPYSPAMSRARADPELITSDVTKVDFSERPFKVWDEDELHLAKTVIIATGARANYLGLESEEKLKNRGVSACAVCDGALFKGKPVTVVGGGDTAMEEATYLTGLCPEVTLIHRRDEFRASKVMAERALNNPKIKMLLSHQVVEVLDPAKERVTGVKVKDLKSGEERVHDTSAVFMAIGHTPMTELFVDQLELHPNKYIKVTPGTARTSVDGVFASGDVMDWTYRQAVTAAGTGCMAALEAERWLAANDH